MSDTRDIAPPLGFAVFDEFGRPADDRVQVYATVHMLAERERCAAEITRLRDELDLCCTLKREYQEREAPPSVPDGWALVPVETTPPMRFALESDAPAEVRWARALAEAPQSPQPAQRGDGG